VGRSSNRTPFLGVTLLGCAKADFMVPDRKLPARNERSIEGVLRTGAKSMSVWRQLATMLLYETVVKFYIIPQSQLLPLCAGCFSVFGNHFAPAHVDEGFGGMAVQRFAATEKKLWGSQACTDLTQAGDLAGPYGE